MDTDRILHSPPPGTDEADLVAALIEDEARQGRPHTPRERDAFARGFFSQDHRAEVRRLMALGVEDDQER